ncbi:MAG TPA: TetR family transcriptional regulator C-terminal domain-containing protein [Chloroflexia bacterium]|nr:TetR family transcriptional regulator C-terminal domain-containing protein [Chloroflexia bacterium]
MPKLGMEPIRRAAVIKAAQECIAEEGFENTTMMGIARRANCSTGTVNHYFKNKEDVLVSAMRAASWAVGQRMRQVMQETTNPWRRLDRIIALSLPDSPEDRREWYISLTFWVKAINNGNLRKLNEQRYGSWYRLLKEIVEDGIQQGSFRSIDPELATLSLIGIIDGLGLHASLGNVNVTPEKMRLACSHSIRALLAANQG